MRCRGGAGSGRARRLRGTGAVRHRAAGPSRPPWARGQRSTIGGWPTDRDRPEADRRTTGGCRSADDRWRGRRGSDPRGARRGCRSLRPPSDRSTVLAPRSRRPPPPGSATSRRRRHRDGPGANPGPRAWSTRPERTMSPSPRPTPAQANRTTGQPTLLPNHRRADARRTGSGRNQVVQESTSHSAGGLTSPHTGAFSVVV